MPHAMPCRFEIKKVDIMTMVQLEAAVQKSVVSKSSTRGVSFHHCVATHQWRWKAQALF